METHDALSQCGARFDHLGQISGDLPCGHCGYNLHSLHPGRDCPECGWPIQRTLVQSAKGLPWLKDLRRGLLFLLGYLLLFECWAAWGWRQATASPHAYLDVEDFLTTVMVAGVVVLGVICTLLRHGRPDQNVPLLPSLALAAFALGPLCMVAGSHLHLSYTQVGPFRLPLLLWLTLWQLGGVLLMVHVSRLIHFFRGGMAPQLGLWCFLIVLLAMLWLWRLLLERHSPRALILAFSVVALLPLPTGAALAWLTVQTRRYGQQLQRSCAQQIAAISAHPDTNR